MFRLPFLEDTSPPPFYQSKLSSTERIRLDKLFIGERSQRYYLMRFGEFDRAGRLYARWNWAAFTSTFGWLLYRKRYLDCLVYCVAGWSFIKLNIVIILALSEFIFVRHLSSDIRMMVRVSIGVLVWLFWSVMVARWADAYYYRMARREIADVVSWTDHDAQRVHLAKYGQTSIIGMAIAFGLFGLLLSIIVVQFVPLVAIKQEQTTIYASYRLTRGVQERVAMIYEQTGSCPVGMPVSVDHQAVTIKVVGAFAGTDSDCAVVATVLGARYPVRYLNGRNLVMYHTIKNGRSQWRCQTSLNKEQAPKKCV